MSSTVATALPVMLDRHFSPKMAVQIGQTYEQSGVVDFAYTWDQLLGWWPASLWNRDNTPCADVIKDPDSFADAFILAALATSATTRLGLAVSTDAIRRGPAELTQTMMTLAAATEGEAVLLLGAGEAKQARPFGYRRAEGLARLEDQLRIYRRFLDADGPFDFAGNHWNLKNAWLGGAMPRRPKVWAMGGGQKLVDLAVQHADGFFTVAPDAYPTAEQFGEQVATIKQALERAGRDPETFDFAICFQALIHDDAEVVERSLDNPLVQWVAAVFGRLNQADWLEVGVEPVFPPDWHYAVKYVPTEWSPEEVAAINAKVSRDMVTKGWLCGTPKEAVAEIQGYVDAGATWVAPCDFLPMLGPLEEAPSAMERSFRICQALKNGG